MTTAFWISGTNDPHSAARGLAAWKSAGVCLWFGGIAGIAERICYHFFPAPLGVDGLWWATLADVIFFAALGLVFFIVGFAIRTKPEIAAFFASSALLLVDCISIISPAPGHAARDSVVALVAATLFTLIFARMLRQVAWLVGLALPMLALYVVVYLVLAPAQWRIDYSEQASAQGGAPNVLLIIVDTLEAGHLSTYGYSRPTSPKLTGLAAQGALFENAVAPSSWTLPSHASILTGRYASEHHAGENDWRLGGRFPTLAEAFRKHGYSTAAFSANPYMFSRRVGLGRGYTQFEEGTFVQRLFLTNLGRRIENRLMLAHILRDVIGRENADTVNHDALAWIGEQQGRPFFVTLNYFDVHEPFTPPTAYLHRFSKLERPMNTFYWLPDVQPSPEQLKEEVNAYDAAIAFTDEKISELLAELKSSGALQNTVVLITSDHGETFDQHGFMFHGKGLYWDLIHVPFVIYAPGRVPAGVHITTPISLQAVPSTLLDLAGIREEKEFPYASVAALWRDPAARSSWPYAISELAHMGASPRFPSYYGPMQSVVTPRWHFIVGGKLGKELYPCCGSDEKNNAGSSPEGEALSAAFTQTLNDEDGLTVTPQALLADLEQEKQNEPAAPNGPAIHNGDREHMNELIRALGYTP